MAIDTNFEFQPKKVTGIFTNYIAKTLPLAFDESMSYYECLCAMLEYLNAQVMPSVNNVNNKMSELVTYMNTYFDNLDVQEEINNKLDSMAGDGSLTALIKAYIDPLYQAYETEINTNITNFENEVNGNINDFENEVNTTVAGQNGRIAIVETRVNSVASGSPANVYNTFDELVSADPDHTRIYVVKANGKWYYYNTVNSNWTEGGIYQSNLIPDGSITPEKTSFLLEQLNEKNLLDTSNLINGYYIGGSLTPIANETWCYYKTEDLIPGESYTLGGNGICIISAFSDNTNVLVHDTAGKGKTFTIPSNANSVFISSSQAGVNGIWISKGTVAFNYKTPYKKEYLIDEDIINMTKYKKNIIVDKNGNGDYTTVTQAVANAQSGETIIVYPGVYDGEEIEAWGKEIHIIGISKNNCIIKNNTCDYNTPPIEFSTGSLKNLTFIAEYNATNYNATDLHAYAIHIEDNYQANKSMLVENCKFESQCNYAVGMGTRGGANIEFNNCEMIGSNPVSGQGGLYFHDASNVSYAGVQNIHFINNKIITDYNGASTDLRIESQGTAGSTVNCEFINNVVINNKTGVVNTRFVDHASGQWKTNFDDMTNFHLSYSSFGNNTDKINH